MKLEGRPSVEEASTRRRLQTRRRCLRVDRHGKSALTFNLWRSAKKSAWSIGATGSCRSDGGHRSTAPRRPKINAFG